MKKTANTNLKSKLVALLKEIEDSNLTQELADQYFREFKDLQRHAVEAVRTENSKQCWRLLKTISKLTSSSKPALGITTTDKVIRGDERDQMIVEYFGSIHQGKIVSSVEFTSFPDIDMN